MGEIQRALPFVVLKISRKGREGIRKSREANEDADENDDEKKRKKIRGEKLKG